MENKFMTTEKPCRPAGFSFIQVSYKQGLIPSFIVISNVKMLLFVYKKARRPNLFFRELAYQRAPAFLAVSRSSFIILLTFRFVKRMNFYSSMIINLTGLFYKTHHVVLSKF